MKNYIITDEDMNHYYADEISDDDINACAGGYLSIIRLSDLHEMGKKDKWIPIENWH